MPILGAGNYWLAAGATLAIALPSYRAGLVTGAGAIAGFLCGAIIIFGFGLNGFALLVFFFINSAVATHYKKSEKESASVGKDHADKRGRDAGQALANTGAAVVAALSVIFQLAEPATAALFFAGALAAAAADTAESELGAVWGRKPRLLPGWQVVEPGTDGAVSWQGSVAGLAVAIALAGLAVAVGLVEPRGAVCAALAGVAATFAESALGAFFGRRGSDPNNLLNTFNTFAGGALAVVLYGW